MDKLSIDEIKKQTMKLLDTNDENEVSYITEELVNMPSEEIKIEDNKEGKIFRSYYGHSMRYGFRWNNANGKSEPTYEFLSNSIWSDNICSGRNVYWVFQSQYNYSSVGFNCVSNNYNTAVIRFDVR